jgi:hypothetical protein
MNLRCAAAPSSPPPPFSILFISSFFFLPLLYSPAWLLVYRCCLACSFNPWFLLSLRVQANAAPKQVRLAEISATGNRSLERRAPCCSASHFFFSFPPHAAASRSGAATLYIFIFTKKSENAVTCDTHRSIRATRIVEYNTRYLAKAQQRAKREGAGKAGRAQP